VEGDAHREESDESEELQDPVDLDEREPVRTEQADAPDARKKQPEAEAEADRQADRQPGRGEQGDRRGTARAHGDYASSR